MGSPYSRTTRVVLGLVVALSGACRRSESLPAGSTPAHPDSVTPPPGKTPAVPAAKPKPAISEAEALRARDDLPPERRALVVVNGAERWVDAAAIESVGYTLVDLSDSW